MLRQISSGIHTITTKCSYKNKQIHNSINYFLNLKIKKIKMNLRSSMAVTKAQDFAGSSTFCNARISETKTYWTITY